MLLNERRSSLANRRASSAIFGSIDNWNRAFRVVRVQGVLISMHDGYTNRATPSTTKLWRRMLIVCMMCVIMKRRLSITMNTDVRRMADEVMARRGFDEFSALLEQLVRDEWDRRFGPAVSPSPPPIASSKIVAAVSPQISIEQARDLAASYADPLTALSTQPDQAFPDATADTEAKPRASLRRRRLRR